MSHAATETIHHAEQRLYLITQVHTQHATGPQTATLCAECLLPWPCRTWRIAVMRPKEDT